MIGLLYFVLVVALKFLLVATGTVSLVFNFLVWFSAIMEQARPDFKESPMTRTDVAEALVLLFGPLVLGILVLVAGLQMRI